jgi:hypothetical protein
MSLFTRKLVTLLTRANRVRLPLIMTIVVVWAAVEEITGYRLMSVIDPAAGENVHRALGWVAMVIVLIASTVISYALQPKPPNARPAALADFDVPTAEEGRPIPVIFGTVWVKGPNVLWYGDLNTIPIKSKSGK